MKDKDKDFNEFCEGVLREMDQIRRQKNLTKTEVGRLAKRKVGYLVGLFNGKARPNLRTVYEIADVMGMDVEVNFVPRS